MAVFNVGVAVEDRLDLRHMGRCGQEAQGTLNPVLVAVGHVKLHTEDGLDQNFTGMGRSAVAVTVARDLIKGDHGVLLMEIQTVLIVITQMDNGVRLHRIHTPAHEGVAAVGIGED